MDYRLKYSRMGESKNITGQCGNVAWTDDEETLGVAFSFEFAKVNDVKIENGDIIYFDNLETSTNVFTGIVTSLDRGRLTDTIRCYDFAFYLNKSEVIIQFNNVSATAALKALFIKVGIPFNHIPLMHTKINKIYKGQAISEVIKGILEAVYLEIGKKYRIYMDGGSVSIGEVGVEHIKAETSLAKNLRSFDITRAIDKSARLTETIEDLKNSIVIVSGDESNTILERAKDELSIEKYGLLEKVITASDKDEAQSRQSAKILLKAMNKVMRTSSIRLIGNDTVMPGKIIDLYIGSIGLVGMYKVKGVSHSIAAGGYSMTLSIEGM